MLPSWWFHLLNGKSYANLNGTMWESSCTLEPSKTFHPSIHPFNQPPSITITPQCFPNGVAFFLWNAVFVMITLIPNPMNSVRRRANVCLYSSGSARVCELEFHSTSAVRKGLWTGRRSISWCWQIGFQKWGVEHSGGWRVSREWVGRRRAEGVKPSVSRKVLVAEQVNCSDKWPWGAVRDETWYQFSNYNSIIDIIYPFDSLSIQLLVLIGSTLRVTTK